jgi:hypothetical protein
LKTQIDQVREDVLTFLSQRDSFLFTPADLETLNLRSYSAERVICYLLFDGHIIRVGEQLFALAPQPTENQSWP